MKKITLLFAVLCVGALNGMETEYGRYRGLGGLSPEIKAVMIMYLNEYDNLNAIVKAIKATNLTSKIVNAMYGNQKEFTAIVHILADKFNITTEDIANKFETPVARTYIGLGTKLCTACSSLIVGRERIDEIIQLLEKDADPNYSYISFGLVITPLWYVIKTGNIKLLKLLLNFGAKLKSDVYYDVNNAWPEDASKIAPIKQLLEQSRQK